MITESDHSATPLAFLLKSYAGDFALVKRLISSFDSHNVEGIHLFCVVPEADLEQFEEIAGPHVTVLSELALSQYFTVESVHGLRPGYINQEIVKLAFWELGLAENYFCVDSEAVFVRDFRVSDFMFDNQVPYTVLVEDNELKVEPTYFTIHWEGREVAIREIMHRVGLQDSVIRTCHGHQIFSAKVLRSFKLDFLEQHSLTYLDALKISPYEFSWYNMWLQKSQVIPIHQREPLVKVFHHEGQELEYKLRGVKHADIARGYLAVVANSSYARNMEATKSQASKPESLAPHLSYSELVQLFKAKLRSSFKPS